MFAVFLRSSCIKQALLGKAVTDVKHLGWEAEKIQVNHKWARMVEEKQNHIGGLNWVYRVALGESLSPTSLPSGLTRREKRRRLPLTSS